MIGKIKRFLQQYQQIVLTTVFLAICADIFFLKDSGDIFIFGVLGIYIACIKIYTLTYKHTLLIGLFILTVMYLTFIVSGASPSTEKAAVWLFFFLGIGVIQQIKE